MSNFEQIEKLANLNSGAVEELFEVELQRILNNLGDINTSYKTAREINIKISFKMTNESRENAETKVAVTSKLAPQKAHEANILLEFNGKDVEAYSKKPEVQPELDNITPISKEV